MAQGARIKRFTIYDLRFTISMRRRVEHRDTEVLMKKKTEEHGGFAWIFFGRRKVEHRLRGIEHRDTEVLMKKNIEEIQAKPLCSSVFFFIKTSVSLCLTVLRMEIVNRKS
jgi:hypothetical protein